MSSFLTAQRDMRRRCVPRGGRRALLLGVVVSACLACAERRAELEVGVERVRTSVSGPSASATSAPASAPAVASAPPGAPSGSADTPAPASSEPRRAPAEPRRELTWQFPEAPFGPMHVVVSVPAQTSAQTRFPVVVAFHGRGESLKGSARGARGWLDDYELARAIERLEAPPLTSGDFHGFVSPERLSIINRALEREPYRGLIVVCPYLPDVLKGGEAFGNAEPLARFVVETLLPSVREQTPALVEPAATAVDGVSSGGRAALLVGFSRPEAFGNVAGVQAALHPGEVERFVALAENARQRNPALRLRLLSSPEDYYAAVTRELSRALTSAGVQHELTLARGAHGYRFNRGPGAYELLLFHDRTLRGLRAL